MNNKKRAKFSGKIGYVLTTAGASVGLGNIWRFPYLTAERGGGIFILVYILLALTFGYTMIISETALGRIARKSPIGVFKHFSNSKFSAFGGFLNAVIPMIIVSYYCVIGGWVIRYLVEMIRGRQEVLTDTGNFGAFIANPVESEVYFLIFAGMTAIVILLGVNAGVERISKIMMPALLILAVIISVFAVTRPGAVEGVKYILVPDFTKFSIMTLVSAAEQMFYSLSIAMGILYTFGSYMKRDTDIEKSTYQVAAVDSIVAILAAMMIIPTVFAYSNGEPTELLNAGPSLLFKTLPLVFANMAAGRIIGVLFFILVTFAALTSSIALMETVVSSVEDEFHLSRRGAGLLTAVVIAGVGSLSSFGYNILGGVTILRMQFLDFFDFISNSVMMPIAALATCVLIMKVAGIKAVEEEVEKSSRFVGKKIYHLTLKYLAPILLVVIFVSSVLNALGIISV
ncbi:MAG: sodium-dependent transporter [Eubacteriales bacterium]|nr:sodium-dependent transporter [Eubacteriales bacterium]